MVRTQQPRAFGCSVVVGLRSATMQSTPKRSSSIAMESPTGPPPTIMTEVRWMSFMGWGSGCVAAPGLSTRAWRKCVTHGVSFGEQSSPFGIEEIGRLRA